LKSAATGSPNLSSFRRAVIAGGVCGAFFLLAIATFVALKLRDQTLRNAGRELSTISRITAERTSQTLQAADLLSLSVRELAMKNVEPGQTKFEDNARTRQFFDALVKLQKLLPQVDALAIIDSNGDPVASSRQFPAPMRNPATSPLFEALKLRPDSSSTIMAPVWSELGGKWMLYLTRPLRNQDGAFLGAIVIGIPGAYFESYFQTMDIGPGQSVSLIGENGELIARCPRIEPMIGKVLPRWFPNLAPAPDTTTTAPSEGADGLERLIADTRFAVGSSRLYVGVGQTMKAVLQPWRNGLIWLAVFSVISLLVLAALVFFILRAIRQEEEWSNALLERETLLSRQTWELTEARDLAETANRVRSEFLANMSHELRTPLSAVLGFSEILDQELYGPLGDRHYKEFVRDILDSGRHLLTLIGNILDLASIDSGRMALDDGEVDAADLIAVCARAAACPAKAANVELSVIPPAEPVVLRGDAIRLQQVLNVLLSNAVKFTPSGGLVVLSGAMCDDGFGFSVRDTGIGMTPDEACEALQSFRQVDNSIARRYEGAGLGLPLANALVLLHGGRLTIGPAEGGGTIVIVTLPKSRVVSQNLRGDAERRAFEP
jgi:signal transduction histidine kinase